MAKSFYFSIQSWMLEEMDLPLADVAVFAYINGLSNAEEWGRQGWHGSRRKLATVMHVSPSTMNDILNRLKKRGYIRFYNGYIISNFHRELPQKKEVVRNPDNLEVPEGDKVPF